MLGGEWVCVRERKPASVTVPSCARASASVATSRACARRASCSATAPPASRARPSATVRTSRPIRPSRATRRDSDRQAAGSRSAYAPLGGAWGGDAAQTLRITRTHRRARPLTQRAHTATLGGPTNRPTNNPSVIMFVITNGEVLKYRYTSCASVQFTIN